MSDLTSQGPGFLYKMGRISHCLSALKIKICIFGDLAKHCLLLINRKCLYLKEKTLRAVCAEPQDWGWEVIFFCTLSFSQLDESKLLEEGT